MSITKLVDYLRAQLKKPYILGAAGPDSFDCSGLIYAAFKETCGIEFPRLSTDQYGVGDEVEKDKLQAGDIVFFDTGWTDRKPNHNGVYLGDGKFINANTYYSKVVEENLDSGYWTDKYYGAKRVASISDNLVASTTVATSGSGSSDLKKGSSGEDVKQLQEKLKELGYFVNSGVTDYYGDVTENAVIEFQLTYQLIKSLEDEICGVYEEKTKDALKELSGNPFSDVALTDKHARYIVYLKKRGIVEGYSDGTFKPDAEINRAESLKMILEAFRIAIDSSSENPFTDIKESDWFYSYVITAYRQKIINGFEEEERKVFKPANPMTRAEVAKVSCESGGVSLVSVEEAKYEDVKVDDWFYNYVMTADEIGMLEPSGTKMKPNTNITRGEMCRAIVRTSLRVEYGL